MKPILFPVIILLAIPGCKSSEPKVNSQEIKFTTENAEIVTGNNRFGLDLFREITRQSNPDENVFISPLSIHTALGMAWNGAATSTRDQMSSVMNLPRIPDRQINENFLHLSNTLLLSDPKVKIDIANSIWYRKGYKIKNEFLAINRDFFRAEVKELDFRDPKSKTLMNNWVANKTNNKITQIVDEITSDHVMFLINAVYFKGLWKKEFKVENTRHHAFFMPDGSQKQVMTMEMTNRFSYTERQGYKVAELPYGDEKFSMLILLPDQGMPADKLIRFLTAEEWNEIDSDLGYMPEMELRLPRFQFSYETELKTPLMILGMNEAFIPELANFSGITDQGIHISRVKHKTFVDVNEEGTEAAAVTSIEFRETAMPSEPIKFYVDRPFVFVLRDKATNTILFIGKVMDPEKN